MGPAGIRAMILAAGRGERMRPLTDHCPKPLLKVGDRSLIEWHLSHLANAGFREIVINHAHLGILIEQALGDGSRWGLRIRYSAEAQALETAGGIRQALPLLGDAPFVVVNGDIFSDFDMRRARDAAERLKSGPSKVWCVLVDNPAHHPEGDFYLVNGRLSDSGSARLTFSGIGAYRPVLFGAIESGQTARLAPIIRQAIAEGAAEGERHGGRWVDVGTPARLAELDAQLRSSATE
jgi:MurNAc alpha-1-phosphate uridylyltransferase